MCFAQIFSVATSLLVQVIHASANLDRQCAPPMPALRFKVDAVMLLGGGSCSMQGHAPRGPIECSEIAGKRLGTMLLA